MESAVRERFEKIEAILQGVAASQAAAEARMERMEARMDLNYRRFEKRMRGFEKLVGIGMAELRRMDKAHEQRSAEIDRKIDALVDAQQQTEASLKALLDSLRKGGNGHRGSRPS